MVAFNGRRQLADHVTDALTTLAWQQYTEDSGRRDLVADWIEDASRRVVVSAEADQPGRRVDTRSLALTAYLPLHDGNAVRLCTVRVRDLCDADGNPIDARATARDLLAQHQHQDGGHQ